MSRDEKSSYYDAGGIESIEVIQAKSTVEQYYGYLHGNVLKYALRRNFKGCSERDTEKCGVYNELLLDFEKAIAFKLTLNIELDSVPESDYDYIMSLVSCVTASQLIALWTYFENRKVDLCQVH